MNREEKFKENLRQAEKLMWQHKTTVLELATGYGKTRLALELAKIYWQKKACGRDNFKVLVMVDKNVHKQSWKDEIKKWGMDGMHFKFYCYASIKKLKDTQWDFVIYDECHHVFTENRLQYSYTIKTDKFVLLSATISRNDKYELKKGGAAFISIDLQDAIDDGVLPTPRIILIPVTLKGDTVTYMVHKASKLPVIKCKFEDRFQYMKMPNPIEITCEPRQYYNDLSSKILMYKRRHLEAQQMHLCTERLKWLSEMKEEFCLDLLYSLRNRRTLTFCSSIAQTERLGKFCINSKNKSSAKYLEDFNNKKIKHITACQQLNEGVNLVDCQLGIYCNINSSERINKQKFGRLLRHKKPVIVIPYFTYTREEEIVAEIIKGYDKEFIETIVPKNGKVSITL